MFVRGWDSQHLILVAHGFMALKCKAPRPTLWLLWAGRWVGERLLTQSKTMAIQELTHQSTHQYAWFSDQAQIYRYHRELWWWGLWIYKKKHLAKKVKWIWAFMSEWIWAPFMSEFYASGRITAPILDTGNWQSIDKKPVGCAGLLIAAWHGRARCWCGEGRNVATNSCIGHQCH